MTSRHAFAPRNPISSFLTFSQNHRQKKLTIDGVFCLMQNIELRINTLHENNIKLFRLLKQI